MTFTQLLVLIALLSIIVFQWIIIKRTGLNPWISILMLIPFTNLFAYWYVAMARWPNEKAKSGNFLL